MTDLVKLMGIKGDAVRLSNAGVILPQNPGFKALNPRLKNAPQQYALGKKGAVSPITKALNSKMT